MSMKSDALEGYGFYICEKGNDIFDQGRGLVRKVYSDIWGTSQFNDDVDLGVVALNSDGATIGNVNVVIRKPQTQLPSECFYYPEHWLNAGFSASDTLCELTGLSVDSEVRGEDREYIIAGIISFALMAAMDRGISLVSTVQRKRLVDKLEKKYRYHFVHNATASFYKSEKIPNDGYWQSGTCPEIYYMKTSDAKTLVATFNLIRSMSKSKIRMVNFSSVNAKSNPSIACV